MNSFRFTGPVVLSALLWAWAALARADMTIVSPPGASSLETLAAREVRRYVYLRTGTLLPIRVMAHVPEDEAIVVARKDRPLVTGAAFAALGPQQYILKTDGKVAWVVGGDDVGTLYGAYRCAEHLGVRFYLHGDVLPDARIPLVLPALNETGKPLFETRGIQPFHDFPEGPDWWDTDDYLAYIGQLAKLRMNFIGLHCYPEGKVGPEPAVWIGQAGDVGPEGRVAFSYPAQWANTVRPGMWGYAAMSTSAFAAGAALLFPSDPFGPAVIDGLMPRPEGAGPCNALFDRTAALFRVAFTQARSLGIKTCIGTETPLTIPRAVQERLREQGKDDPRDPAVVRALYEGMFRRIAAAHPLDYYWLWTPETWTWGGNKPEQFQATAADIHAAFDALEALGHPFTLATCGWVLGPQHDRAALDAVLPKTVPMSCINRQVGHAAVEPSFAAIQGRPKWAIPWMENDPNLAAPQPWVGRMRYDAADALRLGCTGLLGIHWRTKAMAPNVAALAAAAWDQPWAPLHDRALEADRERERALPVEDFYRDFARANFGPDVGYAAGAILTRIDGSQLPEPSGWTSGPGGVKVNPAPWSQLRERYAFVEELSRLRPQVQGAGNRERFDYWLNTYRAMSTMAMLGCLRGELDQTIHAWKAADTRFNKDSYAREALTIRLQMARAWESLLALQIAVTDTPGELGTLANLEQHSRTQNAFLTAHDQTLAAALGGPLPAEAQLSPDYAGPGRLIVPTVRTQVAPGEPLRLKVIAVGLSRPTLAWRPLGASAFRHTEPIPLGRAVFTVTLPPAEADFEYFLEAETSGGSKITWPPTAPGLNQSVIVVPTAKQ
jgi:hypothetical protein